MTRYKAQFSAIALIVMLLLAPARANAKTEESLKVTDSTAGKPALILLTGKPLEVVTLEISNPLLSIVRQKFQLSDKGVLQYWYPQTSMAGNYGVKVNDHQAVFTVNAGEPSAEKSALSIDDYTGFVGQPVKGTVRLSDSFGNPLSGRPLSITTKGSATVSCFKNCITNAAGQLGFQIDSEKMGLKKLLVMDIQTAATLFQEDIGFLPQVQEKSSNSYQISNRETDPLPYIPVFDSLKANSFARGNDDRAGSTLLNDQSFWDFLKGDIVSAPKSQAPDAPSSSGNQVTLATPSTAMNGFQVIMGTDPTKPFEKETSVTAGSALDFVLKAVNRDAQVVKDYSKTVVFEISPKGPVLPDNYSFTPLDQGQSVFELALVLPAGNYTLSVKEKDNPQVHGELLLHATPQGSRNLNNSTVVLNLDAPIVNGKYSKSVSVQGSVNTENTEVVVKDGAVELKRVKVGADKTFQFVLDLADGKHALDISAVYLVDGSKTQTTVNVEVDRTPPVIIKAPGAIPPVRAGQPFTLSAEAEEGTILKAFINNRAYEFVGSGTSYTLTATAPLDIGEFPLTLQISDTFGNVDSQPNVATVKILPALEEIKNLYGIPGMGAVTVAFDPVKDAVKYEVVSKSVFGTSETVSTNKTSLTMDKLSPEAAYTFVVVALDAAGQAVSLPTETKTLSPLAGATADAHNAAELPKLPSRHTSSGPEVYLLVILSIVIMHLYARFRKSMVSNQSP